MFSLSKLYVTFLYIGYIKIAPGTVVSLISFVVLFFLNTYLDKIFFFLIFIICLILSIYLVNTYNKFINTDDPSEVVIDEFLGVFIIFFFIDYATKFNNYTFLILAFFLFRFFDILKPFPISWIDKKIKNSFGVIFDDIVAGIYTTICLLIINEFI